MRRHRYSANRESHRGGGRLIAHEGRYLIARRKAGVHLGGVLGISRRQAGGRRNVGGMSHREFWEELNVRIDIPVPFQIVRHEYPEKTVELHFFRCRIESGEAIAQDCAELRWVYPHELAAFEFPSADQAIIAALQQEARVRAP